MYLVLSLPSYRDATSHSVRYFRQVMSPTPIEQITQYQDRAQAPTETHTKKDGASTAPIVGEDMARLLDMVTELIGDIEARLTRLEVRN